MGFNSAFKGLIIMSVSGLCSVSNRRFIKTPKLDDRKIRIHTPMGKIKKQCHLSATEF